MGEEDTEPYFTYQVPRGGAVFVGNNREQIIRCWKYLEMLM